jgi:hypothetical protein
MNKSITLVLTAFAVATIVGTVSISLGNRAFAHPEGQGVSVSGGNGGQGGAGGAGGNAGNGGINACGLAFACGLQSAPGGNANGGNGGSANGGPGVVLGSHHHNN